MVALQKLLVFAEDPGAVNCIAPLAAALERAGVDVDLVSDGFAEHFLTQRGLRSRPASAASKILSGEPQAVIVGTSENLDSRAFELVSHAHTAGLPSVAVVDSPANAHMRFRGRSDQPLRHAPDWLLVPDDVVARAYAKLGFREANIVTVGHPSNDELVEARAELDRAGRPSLRDRHFAEAGGRTVLTFVSEISTGLDPAQFRRSPDYGLTGRGRSDLRTEIVVEELADALTELEAQGLARPWLVLRRHPKEVPGDLRDHLGIFDQISVGGVPREVVYASDVVVGMTSMLLAEANHLGAKCLSILPRAIEREWLPEIRDGAISAALTHHSLLAVLGEALRGPFGEGRPLPAAAETSVSRMIRAIREVVG